MAAELCRTKYGANKYAALHLMYSKWFRQWGKSDHYYYVTLGGTELMDSQSLYFIDAEIAKTSVSFELDSERLTLAEGTAEQLKAQGKSIIVREGDIFDFSRTSDDPHLFFIDLEGTCALGDFYKRFADLFRKCVLREDDGLLITSYIGRNIGWPKLFRVYDAEFRLLGLTQSEERRICYRRAHPSFTLFRALEEANLVNDIALQCFGCVEYRDKSPMALYGYTIAPGRTKFIPFVSDTPYFHVAKGYF